jgi:hypothetical protein
MGFDKVDASEVIVTETYKLEAFEKIDVKGLANVKIIQSEEKNGVVELKAPDNYIELFKFDSKDGRLVIDLAKKVNLDAKNVLITVYTTDLIGLYNSGVSHVKMDSLDTDKMEVINSGVGDIEIGGVADDVKLVCSGVGSIRANQLKAINVKADVSGVGSVTCYASERIDGTVSGVGSLKYAGHPKVKNTHRSGIGGISEQ